MSAEAEDLNSFNAVREVIENKMFQEYYGIPTRGLPERMQPKSNRPAGAVDEAISKVEWDDWKKWEWLQPGWKGPKLHVITSINADQSVEVRAGWL